MRFTHPKGNYHPITNPNAKLEYTNYQEGYPTMDTSTGYDKNCMALNLKSGLWTDRNCDSKSGFICMSSRNYKMNYFFDDQYLNDD